MKHTKTKALVSIILTVLMVFSSLPITLTATAANSVVGTTGALNTRNYLYHHLDVRISGYSNTTTYTDGVKTASEAKESISIASTPTVYLSSDMSFTNSDIVAMNQNSSSNNGEYEYQSTYGHSNDNHNSSSKYLNFNNGAYVKVVGKYRDSSNVTHDFVMTYKLGTDISNSCSYTTESQNKRDALDGFDIELTVKKDSYNVSDKTLTVKKLWSDNTNKSVDVDVQRKTADDLTWAFYKTYSVSGNGTAKEIIVPSGTYTKEDNASSYTAYSYKISEKTVSGYSSVIYNSGNDNYTVVNTLIEDGSLSPSVLSIVVEKSWEHGTNAESDRPESITLKLMNGRTVVDTAVVTANDDWKHNFNANAFDNDGELIQYTVEEETVENYKATYTQPSYNAVSINCSLSNKSINSGVGSVALGSSKLIVAVKGGSYYVWTDLGFSSEQFKQLLKGINAAKLNVLGTLTTANTTYKHGIPATFEVGDKNAEVGYSLNSDGLEKTLTFSSGGVFSTLYAGTYSVTTDYVAEVLNTYTAPYGNLVIVKEVNGLPSSLANKTFSFSVYENYGTASQKKVVNDIELTATLSDGAGNITSDPVKLPIGNYTVVENSATYDGYNIGIRVKVNDGEYSDSNSCNITVTNKTAVTVSYKNTYDVQRGTLELYKNVSGLPSTLSSKTFTFDIYQTGSTTVYDTVALAVSLTDGAGSASRSVYLPIGNYTITEQTAEQDNYTLETSVKLTGDFTKSNKTNFSVTNNAGTSVTYKNEYTPVPGSITITKTIVGYSIPLDIHFTLTDSTGESTDYTIPASSFEKNANTYKAVYKISDIIPGKYTVTEDIEKAEVVGYDLTVSPASASNITVYPGTNSSAVFANRYSLRMTEVSVVKLWNDATNQDGKRPDAIKLTLLADGIKYSEKTLTGTGNVWSYTWDNLPVASQDAIGSITNVWTASWQNLLEYNDDKIVVYTVKETAFGYRNDETGNVDYTSFTSNSFNGYTVSYPTYDEVLAYTNNADDAFDEDAQYIMNTHTPEIFNLKIDKAWDDNDDNDRMRPASIYIDIYKDGIMYTTAEVNASQSWTTTINGLPVYSNGTKIVYTFDEHDITGYTKDSEPELTLTTANGITTATYTFTNEHTLITKDLSVQKLWDDAGNNDGYRPDSITANLLVNGVAAEEIAPVTLSSDNNWTASWTDLLVYKDGVALDYSVSETAGEFSKYYSVEYATSETIDREKYSDSLTQADFYIINLHKLEKADFSVTKLWNDNDNNDGLRPSSVTIGLFASDDLFETVELSEKNNWAYTFKALERFSGGEEMLYTVKEIMIGSEQVINDVAGGYTVSYENDKQINDTELAPLSSKANELSAPNSATYFTTITNTHVDELIDKTVTVRWEDENNKDGLRPKKIALQLYANGKTYGEPVTLNTDNGESHTWSALSKYKNGVEIVYTCALLDNHELYSLSYSGDSYTITNVYVPEVVSISVTKVWDDKDDADGIRPESVKIQLLANGKAYGEAVVIGEKEKWCYTAENLPTYIDGEKVVFSVAELDVADGYKSSIKSKGGVFTVTNFHSVLPNEQPKTGYDDFTLLALLLLGIAFLGLKVSTVLKKKKTR